MSSELPSQRLPGSHGCHHSQLWRERSQWSRLLSLMVAFSRIHSDKLTGRIRHYKIFLFPCCTLNFVVLSTIKSLAHYFETNPIQSPMLQAEAGVARCPGRNTSVSTWPAQWLACQAARWSRSGRPLRQMSTTRGRGHQQQGEDRQDVRLIGQRPNCSVPGGGGGGANVLDSYNCYSWANFISRRSQERQVLRTIPRKCRQNISWVTVQVSFSILMWTLNGP